MLRVPRRLARKYVSPDLVRRARGIRGSALVASGSEVRRRRADGGAAEADPLIAALREGRSLADGLVAEVRDRVAADDISGATAMAAALSRDTTTEEVGHLCFGIVSFHRGYVELAWQKFSSTPSSCGRGSLLPSTSGRASTRTSRPCCVRSRDFWPRPPPT